MMASSASMGIDAVSGSTHRQQAVEAKSGMHAYAAAKRIHH
jgi:hypothetical protein